MAEIAFATSVSSTLSELGMYAVALELHLGPDESLAVEVSVQVADLLSGTAESGTDYVSLADQIVSFTSGQSNGALQTVNVIILEDGVTEGDESVELGLSEPSAACRLGAIDLHVLTITDDDFAGNAGFLASEGPTGTENVLSYDEVVSLGSQTVGNGPNTGTLLRVTNSGDVPMSLGSPSLTGTHDEDFAIELESSSLERPGPLA